MTNSTFVVHRQADWRHEVEQSDGRISSYTVYECTCKHCGRKCDKTKKQIKTMKSCGVGCPHYDFIRRQRASRTHKLYAGKTAEQWAEIVGISKSSMYRRLREHSYEIEKCLYPKIQNGKWPRGKNNEI